MISEDVASVAPGNPLSRWEPRVKLIGIMCLAFAFAAVQDIELLPLMLCAALLAFVLSSLPASYLARRMRLPGIFLLAMALVLPFFSGSTVLVQLGPISLKQEGSLLMVMIAVKFFCIIAVAAVLFASTPMTKLIGAMRSLGLPSLLGDMLLFTYRYIYQLAADIQRARTAARLRGTRIRSFRSIRTTAYIVGSLIARSHEQAERVFQAMTLRGYGRQDVTYAKTKPQAVDLLACATCIALAATLVLLPVFVL
ncbi:MAG: cobalt ECF transporter T component CbiQ [Actinomycetota bacterium]|nr:cobalt ECF transporter T component CbiQ [Actinomycetota bacterium]